MTNIIASAIGPIIIILSSVVVFSSAFLLFLLEPIVGRMLLPKLGGAPLVWNTCLVFFQCALLLGYLLSSLLVFRTSKTVQGTVLITCLSLSSILPDFQNFSVENVRTESLQQPISWVFLWLTFSIGFPFVGLSIVSSLIQAWLARIPINSIENPYILFAASNLGSLLGLISYPLLVEPLLGLDEQIHLWKSLFTYFIIFTGVTTCLLVILQKPALKTKSALAPIIYAAKALVPTWIYLAALPSALLSAVSQYILTDIASVPLLWLIPLILYLISFILSFSVLRYIPLKLLSRMSALLCLMVIIVLAIGANEPAGLIMSLHLCAFFCVSLLGHCLLSLKKPSVEVLTLYYLALSFGGALGGILILFLAPLLFSSPIENPLLIILAVSLRLFLTETRTLTWRTQTSLICCTILFIVAGTLAAHFLIPLEYSRLYNLVAYAPVVIFCYSKVTKPLHFLITIATFSLIMLFYPLNRDEIIATLRNFYGTLKVVERKDDRCRELYYGTTIHGIECPTTTGTCDPLTYYHRSGPIGGLFSAITDAKATLDVGVIGLGIGSLSCYARAQDRFTFLELNPLIKQIADSGIYFKQLQQSRSKNISVIMGDARLTLRDVPDLKFDLLIIDAFSSDSIPVHLLTLEAVTLYQQHLREGTFIVFHISNRFFDLKPVLADIANTLGLEARSLKSPHASNESSPKDYYNSEWVVLTSQEGVLHDSLIKQIESSLIIKTADKIWTDQYSSPLKVIRK